jgi:thioredoxin 1
MTNPPAPRPPLHLACLCAGWCRTCDSYRPTLQHISAGFVAAGQLAPPRWIDIEDEADLVDDVDIETFPTLLIYDEHRVLFAGPLTPQPEVLQRLVERLLSVHEATSEVPEVPEVPPPIGALVGRLRALDPQAFT